MTHQTKAPVHVRKNIFSFDQQIAVQISVNAAIVFQHIRYWLDVNVKNEKAIKNGKVWMFETQEEMADFFGFLSKKEVREALDKLESAGLIIKDRFNTNPFDRTYWYTIIDQPNSKSNYESDKKSPCRENENSKSNYESNEKAPSESHFSSPSESHFSSPSNKEQQKNNKRIVVVDPPPVGEGLVGNTPDQIVLFNSKNIEFKVHKQDLYSFAVRARKDWTSDEIDKAWKVLEEKKGPINDWLAFCEGIIDNSRKTKTIKDIEKQEEKCLKNSSPSKKPSSNSKEKTSAPVTTGLHLANWIPPWRQQT